VPVLGAGQYALYQLGGDGQAGVAFAWLALSLTLVAAMVGGFVQIADLFGWRLIRKNS